MSGQPSQQPKRGPFKRLFKPSPKTPSPARGAGLAIATPPHSTASSSSVAGTSSDDLLNLTLHRLSAQDQATINEHLPSNSSEIGSAVQAIHAAAAQQRELCESRRWKLTVRGQEIRPRDSADKIMLWVDKLAGIGDLAALIDPIHTGLPWAGVRLLLEVVRSERQEMNALFSGLELALYMTNRLKLYCEYFASLQSTTTSAIGFKKAIIEFYAFILEFLANGLRTLQRASLTRTLHAVWSPNSLTEFEVKCDKVAIRTSEQAQICERELVKRGFDDATRRHAELLHGLKDVKNDYDEVRRLLTVLQEKIDQGKLPIAHGAAFDSYEQQYDPICLKDTRVDLLKQIDHWAADPNSKSIFWLSGMAGTGKSTISRTVAQTFQDRRQLGASFFFKRGAKGGDRGSARKFFTTLAAQLARNVPKMQQSISDALDNEPDLPTKGLQQQFEELILQPLSSSLSNNSREPLMIVAIDALDECEGDEDVRTVLQLLEELKTIVRLRIFVTSRPELSIVSQFSQMSTETHLDIILHEITEASIEHDIGLYLESEFKRIRVEHANLRPRHALADDWPGPENIKILTERANPLFIFASTISKFVGDSKADPELRLKAVLERPGSVASSKFDDTYQPILDEILRSDDEEERAELVDEFKRIVGPIIVLFEPLPAKDLAGLLGLEQRRVDFLLDRLQSVLSVPRDPNMPVRLLHLSFRDFLVDERKKGKNELWIDERDMHGSLCDSLLDFLSEPGRLKSNPCNLDRACIWQHEVPKQTIMAQFPPDLLYACQYWAQHSLQWKDNKLPSEKKMYEFLNLHFLHWIEALIWLDCDQLLNDTVYIIQDWIQRASGEEFRRFLEDLFDFVEDEVDRYHPLQTYSLAKFFFPHLLQDNAIDEPECTPTFRLRELKGHDGTIMSLQFLEQGTLLTSSSSDDTVRLWDSVLGREINSFSVQNPFCGFAFSHNGRLLASGFDGHSIIVRDTTTGEEIYKFWGHQDRPSDFAFSRDLQWLASASEDGVVKLWDLESNSEKLTSGFRGGPGWSPLSVSDGGRLVALCQNRGIKLWDCSSDREVLQVENGRSHCNVAVSADGRYLVSATSQTSFASPSVSAELTLWDVRKEAILSSIWTDPIQTISFNNDNTELHTNLGKFNIENLQLPESTALSKEEKAFSVKRGWIQYEDEYYVKLPHRYKWPFRYTVAIAGNKVALANPRSCEITLLEIEPPCRSS